VIAPDNKVQVTLLGGSKMIMDYATKVGSHTNPTFNRQARVEIDDNKIVLTTLDRFMNNNNTTWIPKEELLKAGQTIHAHAHVKSGAVQVGGEATPQEVRAANAQLGQMKR